MQTATKTLPPGTAPIKPEFILSLHPQADVDDDNAEGATTRPGNADDGDGADARPLKRQRVSGAERRKRAKENKERGMNKGRRFGRVTDDLQLCWKIASGGPCDFGDEFTHDVAAYLAAKPRDIHFPRPEDLTSVAPFVALPQPPSPSQSDAAADALRSVDFGGTCPVFAETGACRHGLKCRFLGGHARRVDGGAGLGLVQEPAREAAQRAATTEMNYPGTGLLKALRTKQYPTPITDEYLKLLEQQSGTGQGISMEGKKAIVATEYTAEDGDAPGKTILVATEYSATDGDKNGAAATEFDEAQEDTPDVPIRPSEKKRLHWQGKTYLAPLTTVGNLPFRRLCTTFGADITCGEMGLATSFLAGSKEEWSLVRRHPAERTFGVQLAGNKPATLVPAAEVLARELGGAGLDFVDLNCGCPIDLVFKNGAGAALLDQPGKLGKILVGMSRALGEIPLTLKVRTGVREGRNTAHRLMPRVGALWGAGAVTIHGRTRQQRYSKLADWDYIKQCVETLRSAATDDDLPTIPIFGGGDCYSAESYWDAVERTGVDGVMVARGALIKPWIFTEIKERREWDISARERLDLIRTYAEYGLNHFGSDTAGVNTTRRYLCEALSFQYRYIPIGLLERMPGRMNDRPPAYRGRDELETLLASGDSRTWVQISEMFLGRAPEEFVFTPKHKSNSYEAQG